MKINTIETNIPFRTYVGLTAILIALGLGTTYAQSFSFQDTTLSDDVRLSNLLSLMTLEEKVANLSNRPPGIPRLGIKKSRIMEGLHGLAMSGPANWAVKGEGEAPTTTFPQAIGLAQMWDPNLHKKIAEIESYEARYLFQNEQYGDAGLIVLAPNADLGRDIRWGRTEECFGEDAFLAARLTVAYVQGLQGDHHRYWRTASLMKHFLANSNENNRFTNSSDFDERLFREYYSYPFYQGIVQGGSRAFMAAYNKYNGVPCHVHPMLREIAIEEWGQNGIICTDGGGFRRLVDSHNYFPSYTQAAAACIQSGINMFLDDYRDPINEALSTELINESDLDERLMGLFRVYLKLGFLDNGANPYSSIGVTETEKPWMNPAVHALVREATAKSVVLLKNEDLLPLETSEIRSIAVIGPSAHMVVSDWYAGTPPYSVSVLDGIRNAVGDEVEILYAESNKADSAVIAATKADVAIVCVGNHPLSYGLGWGENLVASDGREAVDREAISLEQEDLVKLVRKANANTVLVLVSSFPYAIPWSKANIPAMVHITQSSQELGNGLADVLFGKVSPAGRLVQTWTSSIDELLPILEYDIRKGRTYMYDKHDPLFCFGHGLTYTSFEYDDLQLSKNDIADGDTLKISLSIENTGQYDSDEVIQLYVRHLNSSVERPNIELKGFTRQHFERDEKRTIEIKLAAQDLKYWDTEEQQFMLEVGSIEVLVGASSADIRLRKPLNVR